MQPELVRLCELLRPDTDHIYISRSQMDNGRAQLGLSETEQVALPIYKNQDEVRWSIKTVSQIAQPVLFKDDDMMMVIQLEARVNKKSNKTMNFQPSDEQVIKIVS